MAFAHLIVLITINHPRFIATSRILNFPLHLVFIPFLLKLRIVAMSVPRKKLTILIHNNVAIKLTATGYPKENYKYDITCHSLKIVPPHTVTYKYFPRSRFLINKHFKTHSNAACAAANLAIGIRKGLQLT